MFFLCRISPVDSALCCDGTCTSDSRTMVCSPSRFGIGLHLMCSKCGELPDGVLLITAQQCPHTVAAYQLILWKLVFCFCGLAFHQISLLIQITLWGCRSILSEHTPLTWQPPAGADEVKGGPTGAGKVTLQLLCC